MGKQVTHGQLEYSSAITLFKLHAAIAFSRSEAFGWNSTIDITDGRKTLNANRPAEMLLDTRVQHLNQIPRQSGKELRPEDAREVVERLGTLADAAILALFDEFRPFTIHNRTLQVTKDQLADPNVQADPIQKKCQSQLFEGSGIRSVFKSHVDRLNNIKEDFKEQAKPLDDRLISQLGFCDSVRSYAVGTDVQVA